MTLALRVLAAPDHPEVAPGSVLFPPQTFGAVAVDEHGAVNGKRLAVGTVLDSGPWRFALVDAIDVFDSVFSYGQIMIFDAGVGLAGQWTERHLKQGFLRCDGNVGLRTRDDSGHALVRAFGSPYVPLPEDDRVIAVPFRVSSGTVHVVAPGEIEPHVIALSAGEYRVVACQRFFDRDEDLDLFFERVDLPRRRSEILVADRELQPELPLLETADPA